MDYLPAIVDTREPDGRAQTQSDRLALEQVERDQRFLERIAIQGHGNNFEAVRAVVDEWERFVTQPPAVEPVLDRSLYDIGVEERTCNTLERMDVLYVRQLVALSPDEVLTCDNIGPRQIEHLRACLRVAGVAW